MPQSSMFCNVETKKERAQRTLELVGAAINHRSIVVRQIDVLDGEHFAVIRNAYGWFDSISFVDERALELAAQRGLFGV